MVQNTNQTQTTVTTRTTGAPLQQGTQWQQGIAPGTNLQQANVLNKQAIVTNVTEKPVLENVIEKKNIEVHHKPIVQEIHEQKIIEIEKQPVLQSVNQGTVVQQERAATKFEEIGTGSLSEQERLRLQQLNAPHATKVIQQQGAVRQVQEGEQVAQVVRQEFIEHHVQPVVTEVREQNVVQEVVHPVVRKVHEGTIIREVQGSTGTIPLQQNLTTQSSGFQQGSTLQSGTQWKQGAPIQQGFQQGSSLQSGLQQSGLQQGSLQSGTQWQQGAPIQQGFQQGSGLQSGLQQGSQWQQGGLQQGNLATTRTTTMGTGISGTTTTSGINPLQSEQRNLGLHEQKILQKDAPLNSLERSNLITHEQAVDSVVKGQMTGTTGTQWQQGGLQSGSTMGTTYGTAPLSTTGTTYGTAPLGTTTTTGTGYNATSGTHLGNEQKPGFMDRMKEKLHLGGHHNK